ncbi:MAG: hypothetical protein H7249_12960 [Chitinophagaceae bacterium]|nr:hypothetical protein [Oligoflexus sp.]
MGHRTRIALLLISVASVCACLGYTAYHQFYQRGVEAEAKLMMSYAHTLERVYKLENRHFIYWDALYGATENGNDNCLQPEAAAEVGFIVPGCHRASALIPRFAYRIVSESQGERYRIEAVSGSDKAGKSYVCFNSSGHELWQSSQNMEFTQVVSCW